MDKIFADLNEKQIEAVKIIDGPVLVISGPGSGKTKCLTHRVAYLIASGINPANILAITFTNKAAEEMKNRVFHLLNQQSATNNPQPAIGTFHAVCARILRKEISLLGYGGNFAILDSGDQINLMKRVMLNAEVDPKRYAPQLMLGKISKLKTDLVSAENYRPADFFSKLVAKLYSSYQTELKKMNALDFDDLIVFTVRIFDKYPEILKKYQHHWHYILVDEYQDTSNDQYVLIKTLASGKKNLFAIGDDAQSIYAFRDADIRNILNFQKDYPEAKIIMLEQNYRSTKNILAAAQHVIDNNRNQMKKTLWTENGEGNKIIAKETLNERAEARFVASRIDDYKNSGCDFGDFAVLYRTHAQSRAMEEALVACGFPYQIVGGLKFYERREIKDVLAYVKLAHNPTDKISFERIYNVPTRGIGQATFDKIITAGETDLIKAVHLLAAESKKSSALNVFAGLLADFREIALKDNPALLINHIIKKLNYEGYLKSIEAGRGNGHESAEERMENMKELLTVAKKYGHTGKSGGIEGFLEEVALVQETDGMKGARKKITLMTMHSSKGLEFPIVFMIGVEEGLFPHSRAVFDPEELEEERRLCYVAITRAKEKLILTFTKYRNIFGSTETNLPSRFLGEIPVHLTSVETSNLNFDDDYEEKIFY